ncbi:innexin shaking-B [Nephila pilipes]|uniref:Innexin n=1 Tax=Nephila pilipes TaxID=299642 RepID=A0A8X6TQY5_NEPPI|nr:innexin shaking-B [Nephila pilipes]
MIKIHEVWRGNLSIAYAKCKDSDLKAFLDEVSKLKEIVRKTFIPSHKSSSRSVSRSVHIISFRPSNNKKDLCSVIITSNQLVGHPIRCDHSQESSVLSEQMINQYCFISGTFLISTAFNKSVGDQIPHPGIDTSHEPEKFRYYFYYQWICFMFFIQAILFYAPRWIWKTRERGLIEILTGAFVDRHLGEREMKRRMENLVFYVIRTWNKHNWYAAEYMLCEFFAVINVICQFYLTDRFFEGYFWKYGINVIQFALLPEDYKIFQNATLETQNNPMVVLFPRVTKCIFRMYGRTSTVETFDVLCVMTLNNINDKFYLFLWFWLIILTVLSVLEFIKDMTLVFSPDFRAYALCMRTSFIDERKIRMILRKASFGDWFLLDLLSLNLEQTFYTEFINVLVKDKPPKYYSFHV